MLHHPAQTSMEEVNIFLSYSRSDSDFALKLVNDLRQNGIYVWLDQLDIQRGAPFDRQIENALRDCKKFLVVLSPRAVESENVQDEIAYARKNEKTIIPLVIKDCQIPYRIERLQYIDFTGEYKKNLDVLISTLLKNAPPGRSSAGSTMRKKTRVRGKFAKSIAVLGISLIILSFLVFLTVKDLNKPLQKPNSGHLTNQSVSKLDTFGKVDNMDVTKVSEPVRSIPFRLLVDGSNEAFTVEVVGKYQVFPKFVQLHITSGKIICNEGHKGARLAKSIQFFIRKRFSNDLQIRYEGSEVNINNDMLPTHDFSLGSFTYRIPTENLTEEITDFSLSFLFTSTDHVDGSPDGVFFSNTTKIEI